MQVTVIPLDSIIIVDKRPLQLDFDAPANLHALQWTGLSGHIEYNGSQPNLPLGQKDFEIEVKPYLELFQAEAARLDSCPGPAYEWDESTGKWIYQNENDSPGPDYDLIDGLWLKVRFSRKDFMLKCGLDQMTRLNTAISNSNPLAKSIHDLLLAADYIDLTDPLVAEMLNLLTTTEAGNILTEQEVIEILRGLPFITQS